MSDRQPKEAKTPSALERLRAWLNLSDSVLDESMALHQQEDAAPAAQAVAELTDDELTEKSRVAGRLGLWTEQTGLRMSRRLYSALCVAVCCMLIALLLYTTASMPRFGDASDPIHNEVSQRYIERGLQETGAVNIVTGMILDYRAFDTLGESSVLFTAAMVVLLLLRLDAGSERFSPLARSVRKNVHADNYYEPRNDEILQRTAKLLAPIIVLMGVYVVLNGHLSPGGGFSGGAIIGAGLMVYVTAFGFADIRRFFTYKTYQRVVLCALLTYALSKCYSFYTGANGIHSVIPLGTPGAILSSGLIFVLNVCVGFIVACTMYAFYALFRKGEL